MTRHLFDKFDQGRVDFRGVDPSKHLIRSRTGGRHVSNLQVSKPGAVQHQVPHFGRNPGLDHTIAPGIADSSRRMIISFGRFLSSPRSNHIRPIHCRLQFYSDPSLL